MSTPWWILSSLPGGSIKNQDRIKENVRENFYEDYQIPETVEDDETDKNPEGNDDKREEPSKDELQNFCLDLPNIKKEKLIPENENRARERWKQCFGKVIEKRKRNVFLWNNVLQIIEENKELTKTEQTKTDQTKKKVSLGGASAALVLTQSKPVKGPSKHYKPEKEKSCLQKEAKMTNNKAMTILRFLSTNQLDDAKDGPVILANQFYKRLEELEEMRVKIFRAKMDRTGKTELPYNFAVSKHWTLDMVREDMCAAHEAFQFFRNKYHDLWGDINPSPDHDKCSENRFHLDQSREQRRENLESRWMNAYHV